MHFRTAALLSLVIATPLAAQRPTNQAVTSVRSIPRAVIGISVYTGADSDDQTGYPITLITPGSPADRAGLRTGDYITRVNGEPLTEPAVQLWLLQSRLGPDDTVAIEYRRGDVRRTVHLVPMVINEPAPMGNWQVRRSPEADAVVGSPLMADSRYWTVNPRGPLMRLELAPLNPDLGRYFGTSDGVLVISAPEESALNLRGGDVVVTVDGRRPDSPSNLIRILRTYQPDDTIRFEILRSHKHRVVTGQLR